MSDDSALPDSSVQFPGKDTEVNDPKAEAEEIRDASERRDHHARTTGSGVPIGVNGLPMVKLEAFVSDKIPTVQYGNVVLSTSITRYVEDHGDQHVYDAARMLQRGAEYIVGRERTLLGYALDPSKKVRNPYTGKDAFALPAGEYDRSKLEDPRADAEAAEVATKPIKDAPQA